MITTTSSDGPQQNKRRTSRPLRKWLTRCQWSRWTLSNTSYTHSRSAQCMSQSRSLRTQPATDSHCKYTSLRPKTGTGIHKKRPICISQRHARVSLLPPTPLADIVDGVAEACAKLQHTLSPLPPAPSSHHGGGSALVSQPTHPLDASVCASSNLNPLQCDASKRSSNAALAPTCKLNLTCLPS